jgi:uncharacterized membrane protein
MQQKKFTPSNISAIFAGLSSLEIIAFITIVTVGAIARAYFLNQPMRFDESATVLSYINNNWLGLLNYTAPNNHLLNTVLIKFVTIIWGEHPMVIRLPAYLFGCASIVLTFIVCRSLGNSGWFATFMVATHPYLILFSANARGYSALTFFTLLFLYISIRYIQTRNHRYSRHLGLIGAIGLFNLPIMLFPIFGITIWITVQLWRKGELKPSLIRAFYVPFFVYGFIGCLTLYIPVLVVTGSLNGGLNAATQMLFNNEFVTSNSSSFFITTLSSYMHNLARVYSQGISLWFISIVVFLVVTASIGDVRNRQYQTLDLLVFTTLGALLLFVAKHTFPYPRTWIFMLPVVAIIADRGFGYLIGLSKTNAKWLCFCPAVMTILVIPTLMQDSRMSRYQDTGVFEDAPAIAKNIHYLLNTNDSVLAPTIPSNLPLYFYLWYEAKFNPKIAINNTPANTFIFIPNDRIKLEMYAHPPHPIDISQLRNLHNNSEKVFEFNGSIIYKLKN